MSTHQAAPAERAGLDPSELVSIVVPAYNEEAAIAGDLETIFSTMNQTTYPYEVIVVDDGSTDATASIVARYPEARLIRHGVNLGVGAARTTGLRAAQGTVIVTTDGDGTYPNHEIPGLLALLEHSDMAVGARVREAGTWPWLRGAVKGGIQWLASYLTSRPIPDLNSGFRCFRKDVAERFIPFFPRGHSWESTITLCYLTSGYEVAFLPVEYYPRRGGRSSFHPLRDTLVYVRLVMKTVLYFHPLKFFAPLGVMSLFLGAGIVGWRLLAGDETVSLAGLGVMAVGVLVGSCGAVADQLVKRRQRRLLSFAGTRSHTS